MEQHIETLYCRRPHVVIVGAGASAAVMGSICPTMSNAIDVIGLDSILGNITLQTNSRNLEDIYSELFNRGDECKDAREDMEKAIYDYFSNVYLPETLTIYDLLVLSLRNKDCIISFNWDRLLIQAFNRALAITENLPNMLFLHGNVGAGICEDCLTFGTFRLNCPKCGSTHFVKSPLLYPVEKKDYDKDKFIRKQWSAAKYYLSRAGKVTIFGYSAPYSDKAACEILKSAFSKYDDVHKYDSVEIIERPGFNPAEMSDTWKFFFSQTHNTTTIVHSFYDSCLARAPRRTLQFQYRQFIEGWWGEPSIHFSEHATFASVSEQLKPILQNEEKQDFHII